jgi:hypothetical protein
MLSCLARPVPEIKVKKWFVYSELTKNQKMNEKIILAQRKPNH